MLSDNKKSVATAPNSYNTFDTDNQSAFFPKVHNIIIENELQCKFEPKKLLSEYLAYSYERLGLISRSNRVRMCGEFLEFGKFSSVGGGSPVGGPPPTGELDYKFKLTNANFCRDRLCPMCNWRRSYKIFGQVSKIMDFIVDDYEYLFLTLTVPNCIGSDLPALIDTMQHAFSKKFLRYKRIKQAVKGFFKALEITRNKKNNTYHPHFHIVIAVPKGYFKSSCYIKRDEWLEMWQMAMNDYSITQVDIRKCRTKHELQEGSEASKALSSAIAEVAKYSVKSSDYLDVNDCVLTDEVVNVLLSALSNRRLCSFGGCFDEVRKKLNLDDVIDGDLLHLDDTLRSDVAEMIYKYQWSCGCYKLIEYKRNVPVIEVDEDF